MTAPRALPAECTQPSSYLIQGQVESRLTLAALLLARRLDPKFEWFDLQHVAASGSSEQAVLRQLLPDGRIVRIHNPALLRPHSAAAQTAAAGLIEGPDRNDPALLTYLRLPDILQDLVGETILAGNPRTLVVSNLDRLNPYLNGRESVVAEYSRSLMRFGISVVATYRGDGKPMERFFEFQLTTNDLVAGERGPVLSECIGGPEELCRNRNCQIRALFPNELIRCRGANRVPATVIGTQPFPTASEFSVP
ncbi:MAG TPA: hypothetical protein VJS68_04190, partial [Thermoplasmata archaeon]|nr:hypothetical protein [Thermoplasmata archaeon]